MEQVCDTIMITRSEYTELVNCKQAIETIARRGHGLELFWKHRETGRFYQVLMMANSQSVRDDFPKMVVYMDEHNEIWARPLAQWCERMEPLEVTL